MYKRQNLDLGLSMLDSYERVLPMEPKERGCLYYLFLYPEKYWKQLNFYYNANKMCIRDRGQGPVIPHRT